MSILQLTFNLEDIDNDPGFEETMLFAGSFDERKNDIVEKMKEYVVDYETGGASDDEAIEVSLADDSNELSLEAGIQYLTFNVSGEEIGLFEHVLKYTLKQATVY